MQLVSQGDQVRPRSYGLAPWCQQGQVELREIVQLGAGLLIGCGLHEAFRQLAVFAIARCQDDEVRGHGNGGS